MKGPVMVLADCCCVSACLDFTNLVVSLLPPYRARSSAAEVHDIASRREALKGKDTARWEQALAYDPSGLRLHTRPRRPARGGAELRLSLALEP